MLLSTFTSMQYFIFLYRKYLNFEFEAVRSRMFHDEWNKIELYVCEPLTFLLMKLYDFSPNISRKNGTLNVLDPQEMLFNRNKFMIGAFIGKGNKNLSYRWILNEPRGNEVGNKNYY